jgi:hypothetical protein
MEAKPRRRRRILTLAQLKARLSAGIEYAVKVMEDERLAHELRLRGLTGLVQAALAYGKLTEQTELEERLQTLERALAERNGRR